ncbi:hypothetical protein AMETH_5180 [Amycolatopsis methanolica 239]|uniref:Uncharacterized protein n=1 Tax=Amycolatopsis methanolica 239 TaxID=1068978 RepID=A0A076N5L6_AMYME|nr:hypothetical protein AMETH_5180 [Amycolatopsis methanolica 239]
MTEAVDQDPAQFIHPLLRSCGHRYSFVLLLLDMQFSLFASFLRQGSFTGTDSTFGFPLCLLPLPLPFPFPHHLLMLKFGEETTFACHRAPPGKDPTRDRSSGSG